MGVGRHAENRSNSSGSRVWPVLYQSECWARGTEAKAKTLKNQVL